MRRSAQSLDAKIVHMNKPFQREGASSNAHVGRSFELAAQRFFETQGLSLQRDLKIPVGIEGIKKDHSFDLGSLEGKVIVECKSHKWTAGGNVPSAKLTVWNEAMYYFLAAPVDFRKIMFVLYDFNKKKNESLAIYYLRTYKHLVPSNVEFWEYNEHTEKAQNVSI